MKEGVFRSGDAGVVTARGRDGMLLQVAHGVHQHGILIWTERLVAAVARSDRCPDAPLRIASHPWLSCGTCSFSALYHFSHKLESSGSTKVPWRRLCCASRSSLVPACVCGEGAGARVRNESFGSR